MSAPRGNSSQETSGVLWHTALNRRDIVDVVFFVTNLSRKHKHSPQFHRELERPGLPYPPTHTNTPVSDHSFIPSPQSTPPRTLLGFGLGYLVTAVVVRQLPKQALKSVWHGFTIDPRGTVAEDLSHRSSSSSPSVRTDRHALTGPLQDGCC